MRFIYDKGDEKLSTTPAELDLTIYNNLAQVMQGIVFTRGFHLYFSASNQERP
jgi:hypothetical protein